MLKKENINYLIVHCSDTPNSQKLTAIDIHQMHLDFGWNGIGYHKVILRNGEIDEIIIDPRELNVNAEGFDKIIGNDAKFNSEKIIDIFKGNDDAFSKAVSLNTAAGLIISEREDNL